MLKFKRKERKLKNRTVDHILQLQAKDGSAFDTLVILNNYPCDKETIDIIKNGKGIIELKVFESYVSKIKEKILNFYILDVEWLS